MSAELVVVLVLLAVAIVMFAINKPRLDAAALGSKPNQAVDGFNVS